MTAPVSEPSVKVRVVCPNKMHDVVPLLTRCPYCGERTRGTTDATLAPNEYQRLVASALAGLVEEFEAAYHGASLWHVRLWWRDALAALSGPLHHREEGTK